MNGARRILGVDPGSRVTGWGVIVTEHNRIEAVDCGVIKAGDGAFPDRLAQIFDGLGTVVERFQPDEVAVEKVFVNRNAESALKLGQARGAAICAAVKAGLPVAEYAARRIKLALVGTGSADKTQVGHMVRMMTGWRAEIAADASDALAVAVCHVHESETARRFTVARRRGRR